MSNNPTPVSPMALVNITNKLAAHFNLGDAAGNELVQALRQTAFRGPVSDAQLIALLVVANQYGLNPWTREIYAFPDRQSGIVPVVGVDGWSRIINEHPQFDGMDFMVDDEKSCCTCTIYRKDRSHPISVSEYLSECRRNTPPWQSHPRRMLRHKAMVQCARLAFGFAGIHDQDTAEEIIERDMGQAEIVPEPAPPAPTGNRANDLKARLAARLRPASDPVPLEQRIMELGLPMARVEQSMLRRFHERYDRPEEIDWRALPEDEAAWVERQIPRWIQAMREDEEQDEG